MVPKNALDAAGGIRKSANGHCTATNSPKNTAPHTTDSSHAGHLPEYRRTRSIPNAGTMSNKGKLGGINCVTGFITGPSLGCAGNSGRIQISAAVNNV